MIYLISKRILDFVVSLIGFLLLLPLMIILAITIKFSSKGAVVFKQERAGKNAKPFTLYKFRTMRTDVDPFGPSPKAGNDPRLTRIGIFLREHSLDELPQLINVIKGNMSLVGPRPLYISQIPEWDDRQKKRLLVKPGLTGLAQINGRGELTREEKLEFDVVYVENANFWLDIKIILKTFGKVFGKSEIYEKKYSQTEHTRHEKK